MSKINTGGPAFPGIDGPPSEYHSGMTLRDYFAGKFLSGVAATANSPLDCPADADQFDVDAALRVLWDQVARAAYIAADAMIAAREGGAV